MDGIIIKQLNSSAFYLRPYTKQNDFFNVKQFKKTFAICFIFPFWNFATICSEDLKTLDSLKRMN